MQAIDVIYNRYGYPELRLLDNGRLVTFGGKSAGFLKNQRQKKKMLSHTGKSWSKKMLSLKRAWRQPKIKRQLCNNNAQTLKRKNQY
jgi:uncharacterized protein YifE (UPF0438 family)